MLDFGEISALQYCTGSFDGSDKKANFCQLSQEVLDRILCRELQSILSQKDQQLKKSSFSVGKGSLRLGDRLKMVSERIAPDFRRKHRLAPKFPRNSHWIHTKHHTNPTESGSESSPSSLEFGQGKVGEGKGNSCNQPVSNTELSQTGKIGSVSTTPDPKNFCKSIAPYRDTNWWVVCI